MTADSVRKALLDFAAETAGDEQSEDEDEEDEDEEEGEGSDGDEDGDEEEEDGDDQEDEEEEEDEGEGDWFEGQERKVASSQHWLSEILRWVRSLRSLTFERAESPSSLLRHLMPSSNPKLRPPGAPPRASCYFPGLEELRIRCHPRGFTGRQILEMLARCPSLRVLDISMGAAREDRRSPGNTNFLLSIFTMQ